MTCIVKRKGLSRSFLYVLYPPCRDGLRPVKRVLNRYAPGIFLANSEILTDSVFSKFGKSDSAHCYVFGSQTPSDIPRKKLVLI